MRIQCAIVASHGTEFTLMSPVVPEAPLLSSRKVRSAYPGPPTCQLPLSRAVPMPGMRRGPGSEPAPDMIRGPGRQVIR